MKNLMKVSKKLVSLFFVALINHGPALDGETKFDFSGAHFVNVNVTVTNVTYAPTTSEYFLLATPTTEEKFQ
ncbi:hypothetical protein [Pantoea agglomerans]|uniref:hypothetical protein n=1 Tax=Enterobacter agglomerans TaxID=549 RepID=UPI003C79DB0B